MGFSGQVPRVFSKLDIERFKTDQIGVYGILGHKGWIYVGKGDIRERLLAHLNGDNPSVISQRPTHWMFEITDGDPSRREKELIRELKPVCNDRVG